MTILHNVFTISQKEDRDEVDYLHVDNYQSFLQVDFNTFDIKVSYKVILSLLQGMIKHSQRTWSNNFAISLKYLKNEVTNGVHFLHADKHLQVGIIVFDESDQICPKY